MFVEKGDTRECRRLTGKTSSSRAHVQSGQTKMDRQLTTFLMATFLILFEEYMYECTHPRNETLKKMVEV